MKIEDIKFKAKRLDGKGWVEGSLIRSTTGIKERAYIVDNFSSMSDYSVIGVDPSTVCQFTGMKDSEGNEIWEGDIIRKPEFPFEKRTVTWSNNSSCFMPVGEDGCQDINSSFLILFKEWTVVGNKLDKEK